MFATSVGVAILILLAEVPIWHIFSSAEPIWSKFSNLQWASVGVLLHGIQQFAPRSPGGRLIILGYGFLALIVINMYIASYSAIMASRTEATSIRSIDDLVSKTVGIFKDDMSVFKRYALQVHHGVHAVDSLHARACTQGMFVFQSSNKKYVMNWLCMLMTGACVNQ